MKRIGVCLSVTECVCLSVPRRYIRIINLDVLYEIKKLISSARMVLVTSVLVLAEHAGRNVQYKYTVDNL